LQKGFNLIFYKNNNPISFLVLVVALLVSYNCSADTIDTLDNTDNLNAVLNSSVSANGDSTVSMEIISSGDSVINWYDYSYVRLRNHSDRVEVVPTGEIGSGQYSLWVLLFDSSKQLLAEIKWADVNNSTELQVLESVTTLAVENEIENVEYYYIRFRLHGGVGDGFIFDEIRILNGIGYWQQTDLTQSAQKAVFVHEMTGFRTPDYSGNWSGWNYSNSYVSHNPETVDSNGKPDIASVYYPSVGYYDMKDSKLIEYHCQLMKMANIDGVIFDLSFYDMSSDNSDMMSGYLDIMNDYGLYAAVCYEDKSHFLWDNPPSRTEAVNRSYEDMNHWLGLFISSGTQYYVSGNRPLFLLFSYEQNTSLGLSCLLPSEINAWLDTFATEDKPVIMRQWFKNPDHVGVLNGQYSWLKLYPSVPPEFDPPYVNYCDIDDNNDTLYSNREFGQYLFDNELADFHIPGVWPGFDDIAVWGWGDGPRLMPRYDGQLYQNTWQWAIDDNLPVIQVATWNDWFEGTNIEPSVEFGSAYLELTRQGACEFKDINTPTPVDFNIPVWIYRIRDITSDSIVHSDMNTASDFIRNGQFSSAESIVTYWADYFDVNSATYWTGVDSIETEPNIFVADLEFDTRPAGTSEVKPVVIENTGTEALAFVGSEPIYILTGDTDFSIVQSPDTNDLPLAQSRHIQIKFHPQSNGEKSGILRVISDDADTPLLNVNLSAVASQAGDYYPDDKIDFYDLAVISQYWMDTCDFSDLEQIAEQWLAE
jgi:hypothetical protein